MARSGHDLLGRTKHFALAEIRLYSGLPTSTVLQVLGKQMLRSATSVGAHYREGQRAKSNADFVNKIKGALQELDETRYWLELLQETQMVGSDGLSALQVEAEELLKIFVTIARKAKKSSERSETGT